MSYLRPDNFRLTILSSEFTGGLDRKEPWSGTEFQVEKLSPDFLDELAEAFEKNNNLVQLHLPQPSTFLPGQLDVDASRVESPTTTPTLIRHDSNVRTWWKRGDQLVPKGFIHVYFRTPVIAVTVRSELTAALFVNLVYDALAVQLYDATVSGSNYDLSGHGVGFEITLSSYNEKLHVLLEMVVSQVYKMGVREDRFQAIRDRMVQALRDLAFEEP
jgi:insulysin